MVKAGDHPRYFFCSLIICLSVDEKKQQYAFVNAEAVGGYFFLLLLKNSRCVFAQFYTPFQNIKLHLITLVLLLPRLSLTLKCLSFPCLRDVIIF